MYMIAEVSQYVAVASFAEAWIEIDNARISDNADYVASFAEAWIEINAHPCFLVPYAGRLLRGGVD